MEFKINSKKSACNYSELNPGNLFLDLQERYLYMVSCTSTSEGYFRYFNLVDGAIFTVSNNFKVIPVKLSEPIKLDYV